MKVILVLFTLAVSLVAAPPPPDEVKPESVANFTGTKPLPPLPEGAFTFVVIPDTQHYLGKGTKVSKRVGRGLEDAVRNSNLEAQVQWILANKDAQKIVFVTHVGDIV